MTPGLHEIDQNKHDAYVLSVEADKMLAEGYINEARLKMSEAANLDKAYAVRAELIGHEDKRKIRVSSTVRRIIIPFLIEADFKIKDNVHWSEGKDLQRKINDVNNVVLIGRDKFGNRLSILAAKWKDPKEVEYYDWHSIGMRSGSLAYKTQEELELVCRRWCEIINIHILPWFDKT